MGWSPKLGTFIGDLMQLLTRDEFRNAVFKRDNYKCVVCELEAKDAHHIIERRLWPDGGYYIDNGVSLCYGCHLFAEETLYSPEDLIRCAGIKKRILPPHLYEDNTYTKWGDVIINGLRYPGELFYDESVQKILKKGNVLSLYRKYVKYPRTYHLPWSNPTKDDQTLTNLDFLDEEIVITEKMDGENATLYSDYYHARSIDGPNHWTRSWIKNFHSQIKGDIPENHRLCGENLFARHGIHYTNLKSYFYLFSVWNKDVCLSWDETKEWAALLNLQLVPELFRGRWDIPLHNTLLAKDREGYVIRTVSPFKYGEFRNKVGKFVRPGHSAGSHWKNSQIIRNELE